MVHFLLQYLSMNKKRINIVLSLCLGTILFFAPMQTVCAVESNENREYIIELINLIRLDPVSYAVDLGYDRDILLDERPWLAKLLEDKFPLLDVTASLNARAAVLNSPVFVDTVQAPSFSNDYARTGEFGGVVSFYNFMDTQAAIRIVVENRLKSELSWDFQGQRCILNPEFDLAGAVVEAGIGRIEGASGNAYYIMVTLGSSLLKSRRQILNLINQVRANPSGANTNLSFPLDAFDGDYGPLFFDDVLQTFAKVDAIDLDEYARYGVNKSSAIEVFPKTDANAMVFWIFSSLVLNEAKGFAAGRVVFGSYSKKAGIDLLVVNGGGYDHVRLTVTTSTNLGENQKPGYSRIYGLVYVDGNLDGVYTPGEGMGNRIISIYDRQTSDMVQTAVTDNTGHFSVNLLSDKHYTIRYGSNETRVEKEIFLGEDYFLTLEAGI